MFNFSPNVYNLFVFNLMEILVENIPQSSPYSFIELSIKNFNF